MKIKKDLELISLQQIENHVQGIWNKDLNTMISYHYQLSSVENHMAQPVGFLNQISKRTQTHCGNSNLVWKIVDGVEDEIVSMRC